MASAKSFRELLVWQKAHQFVLKAYRYSSGFPREERYSLVPQFRRASISIAANISEGFRKKGKPDKIRFFNISQGSLEECKYYLILAFDLGYGPNNDLEMLGEEVSKLLTSYIRAIEESGNMRQKLGAEGERQNTRVEPKSQKAIGQRTDPF